MGRLSETDLREITRFVAALDPGTAQEPIPRATLAQLRQVIGADDAEYFELRRVDRSVVAHAQSHDWDEAPGSEEALLSFGHQNPLAWRRWRPADGPMRLSAHVGRATLARLEFHDAFLRPNGLTDLLKVWLHSDDESVACIQLWQRGATFGQRQEDLLGVLQHHLARIRAEALSSTRQPSGSASLTRREAEVLTWAMRGDADEEIGARLGIATPTVGKHIEHAFAKLGVHSRTEALWRLSRRNRPGGRPDESLETLESVDGGSLAAR